MRRLFLPGVLILAAACGTPPLVVRELPAPAPAGARLPHLAPREDGSVLLSWVEQAGEGRHRLRMSAWDHGWSAPGTVGEGERWFVNWADFPTVVALDERHLAAHWLEKNGESAYAYGVQLVASADGGRTWAEPSLLHSDRSETEHGFVSLVRLGVGRLGAAWLDGRLLADGGEEAAMTLRAVAFEGPGRRGEEELIDERVCDCCQTSGVVLDDGTWLVAYRDRSAEEVRDIAVARRVEGRWEAGRPVHDDGWRIAGCPVNGPALAAAGDRVGIAWYTESPEPLVHVALSEDAGRTFSPPVRVDEGRPVGRVALSFLGPRLLVVAWLEKEREGTAASVTVRGVSLGGRPGPPIVAGDTVAARASGFPRLAPAAGGVMVAWTDARDETPRIRTALVTLPHQPGQGRAQAKRTE